MTYTVSTNSIAQPYVQVDSSGAEVVPPTSTGQTAANASLASLVNGATSTARLLSAAASTNATSVKASAGTVRMVSGRNARATSVFLKFYNKASAPTVGTDTPRKTIEIPGGSTFVLDCHDYYATGIAFALTTAAADADTGALTAGDIVCLNVDYL